jgi:hypothetical protein
MRILHLLLCIKKLDHRQIRHTKNDVSKTLYLKLKSTNRIEYLAHVQKKERPIISNRH